MFLQLWRYLFFYLCTFYLLRGHRHRLCMYLTQVTAIGQLLGVSPFFSAHLTPRQSDLVASTFNLWTIYLISPIFSWIYYYFMWCGCIYPTCMCRGQKATLGRKISPSIVVFMVGTQVAYGESTFTPEPSCHLPFSFFYDYCFFCFIFRCFFGGIRH